MRDHAHTLGFPRPLLPSRLYYQIYYGRDSEHRPFVGEAPEDRHAERVVGEMLTCLDDFAATGQPRLDTAMGAHIPGSVKGQERFLPG